MTHKPIRSQISRMVIVSTLMFVACLAAIGVSHTFNRAESQRLASLVEAQSVLIEITARIEALEDLGRAAAGGDQQARATFRREIDDVLTLVRGGAPAESARVLPGTPVADFARVQADLEAYADTVAGLADQAAQVQPRALDEAHGPVLPTDLSASLLVDLARLADVDTSSRSALQRMIERRELPFFVVSLAITLLAGYANVLLALRVRRHAGAQERALENSRTRFHDFARSTADVFWEMDANGRVSDLLITPQSDFLVPREQIVGRSVVEVVAGQELLDPGVVARLQRLIADRQTFRDLAYAVRAKDGSWLWRSLSGLPYFDRDGAFLGFRGSILDITARKRAEERYEGLLREVGGAAFTYTGRERDGRITIASESATQLTGFGADELTERAAPSLFVADDHERTNDEARRTIRDTGSFERKLRIVRKDGSRTWVVEKGVMRGRTPTGDWIVDVLMLDISAIVAVEQRAHDAERLLANIVANSGAGFFSAKVLEPGVYAVNYVSPRYCQMLGLDEQGVVAHWNTLAAARGRVAEVISQDIAAFEHPGEFDYEWPYLRPDGVTIWLSTRGRYVKDAEGTLLKEGVVVDITARRAMDERLADLGAALDNIADGVTIGDGAGRMLRVNNAMLSLLGLPSQEAVLGKRPFDLVTPVAPFTVEGLRADLAACHAEGRPWSFSAPFETATGQRRHLEGSVTFVGKDRMISVIRDVTARIAHERAANETQRLLAGIAANSTVGFYTVELRAPGTYTVKYASPRYCELLGIAPEAADAFWTGMVEGNEHAELILDKDRDALAGRLTEFDFEWRYARADGRVLWLAQHERFVREPDGRLLIEGVMLDVTAQRMANDRAADLGTALDQIEDGVTIAGGDGRMLRVNNAMVRLLGLTSQDDALGKLAFELVTPLPPLTVEGLRADLAASRAAGRPWAFSIPAVTASGIARHLEGSVTFVGKDRTISVLRDVSARIAAERRKKVLADSLGRLARDERIVAGDFAAAFRAITEEAGAGLEVARAGIWLMEDAGRRLVCADLFTRADGRHAAGLEISMAGHEHYFERLKTERVIVADDARAHEATICFTAGYLVPLGITSALKVPIRVNDRILGVVCCEHVGPPRVWTPDEVTFAMVVCDVVSHAMDAAERARAQTRLAAQLDKTAQIVTALDAARDAIVILDRGAQIIYANSAMAALTDADDQAGMIGRNIGAFLTILDIDGGHETGWAARMLHTLEDRGHFDFDRNFRTVSGAVKPIAGAVTRLIDGGRIAVLQDKSGQFAAQRREDELREQLAQAKKMEAIGRLAGGIAHDFNNIINATRSFADLIAMESAEESRTRGYAGRIVKACDRATDLVTQIMNYSRAAMAERSTIALGPIIDEVEGLIATRAPPHVSFTVARPDDDVMLDGNAGQLVQVLLNLAVNAFDAVPPGATGAVSMTAGPATPTPEDVERLAPGLTQVEPPAAPGVPTWRYTLGVLRAATPYVRLRVADSGGGIGPILMEHIFEPFFTTKDKARGTGLGLAVAASVVAAHHGCIVVTSALGHGSVFEIYLPRVPAEAAAAAATHERGAGGGHGRVMLIDDEIDLADGLSMALSAMGYEALPVYDPEEALELFAENPAVWDVVVTDQVMPRLKGLSVIRQLKRLRPDIPVILCTGFSDMADEQEALGAGAAAFARKPISAERLAALLRDVIESRARVAAAE